MDGNYGWQIMEDNLWTANYGRKNDGRQNDGKLWKRNVMANYGGQLWRTIYRGQLWQIK